MPGPIASLPPTSPAPGRSPGLPGVESETLESGGSANVWADKDKGFTFEDFLDIINPLQHLPIVSTIYRAITGDEIGLAPRVIGGGIFGGPLGMLLAGVTAAFEEVTGGDPADHLVALFNGISSPDADDAQLAGSVPVAPDQGATSPASVPAVETAPGPAPSLAAPSEAVPSAIVPADIAPAAGSSFPGVWRMLGAQPFSAMPGIPALPKLPSALSAPSRHGAALPAQRKGDAESRRIAQAILDAQRAQAKLLLASLATDNPRHGVIVERPEPAARGQTTAPITAHANLPPRGAPPAWYSHAMERALAKYETTDSLLHKTGADISVVR